MLPGRKGPRYRLGGEGRAAPGFRFGGFSGVWGTDTFSGLSPDVPVPLVGIPGLYLALTGLALIGS